MILELAPRALKAISPLDATGKQIFRIDGPSPGFALSAAAGGDLLLSPGLYHFSLEARVLSGALPSMALRCDYSDGRSAMFEISKDRAPNHWSGEFKLAQVATGLQLVLEGASGSFALLRASLNDLAHGPEATPTLRDAAVLAARAVFRRSPMWLRAAVLRRRAAVNKIVRSVTPSSHTEAGRIEINDEGAPEELTARRIDFEQRLAVARGGRDEAYVENGGELGDSALTAKIVAFYLPQFHAIPENDAWWGRGFTEWTNTSKANPQFVGHYQPRLPGELGHYDLRTPGVVARQAELAKAYGVSAFCFHYYWFAGKRLLEAPLEIFLSDRSINIQFMLCWANENWTRRWDGEDDRILIAQNHSPEDHAKVFADIARHFEDPRAIRVSGMPAVMVYRPGSIPGVRRMIEIWRECARARGLPGIFLIASNAFDYDDWRRDGFDAQCEFPPHRIAAPQINKTLSWLNTRHAGRVWDYQALVAAECARLNASSGRNAGTVFPGVMPSWDNEARRPGAGLIFHGSTPESYGRWLDAALRFAERELPEDRRLVFVNAWNEWAEGAHLEPDRRYGRAYLAATARAINTAAAQSQLDSGATGAK